MGGGEVGWDESDCRVRGTSRQWLRKCFRINFVLGKWLGMVWYGKGGGYR